MLQNNSKKLTGELTGNQFTNFELIKKAGKALVDWSKSGFPAISPEQLEKRERICLGCEHLREPVKLLQKIVSADTASGKAHNQLGNKICGACGCSLKKKINLSTETCPMASPNNPGFNLWEEPILKNNS